jgi:hypothetical protein
MNGFYAHQIKFPDIFWEIADISLNLDKLQDQIQHNSLLGLPVATGVDLQDVVTLAERMQYLCCQWLDYVSFLST